MKNTTIFTAVLMFCVGQSFAAPAATMVVKQNPVPQAAVEPGKNFKDILFKLVRQDEYLDETLEKLDAAKPLSAHEITALGLNLKLIASSLNQVSELNKKEFAGIQPDAKVSNYTNAIFSYSRKMDRKSAKIGALVAQLTSKNKKASLRDAVSSKKGKKGGKKIAQLAAEQKAVQALLSDAKTLRGASRNLNATSKWLYIASK